MRKTLVFKAFIKLLVVYLFVNCQPIWAGSCIDEIAGNKDYRSAPFADSSILERWLPKLKIEKIRQKVAKLSIEEAFGSLDGAAGDKVPRYSWGTDLFEIYVAVSLFPNDFPQLAIFSSSSEVKKYVLARHGFEGLMNLSSQISVFEKFLMRLVTNNSEDIQEHVFLTPKNMVADVETSFGWGTTHASVIEEVASHKNLLFSLDLSFHATDSVTARQIFSMRALESSHKLLKRGTPTQTGEVFRDGQLSKSTHRVDYLDHVFGAVFNTFTKDIDTSYSFNFWFDLFPVSFAINSDRQNHYLNFNQPGAILKKLRYNEDLFGPEVPIENIDFIFVPHIYLNKVRGVLEKWYPHLKVISYEAFELLRSKYMNKHSGVKAKARNGQGDKTLTYSEAYR